MSAIKKSRCWVSSDCKSKEVCNRAKRECVNLADELLFYRSICFNKNIPIIFEKGPRAGQLKDLKDMKRCVRQKMRSIQESELNAFTMPLPPKHTKKASSTKGGPKHPSNSFDNLMLPMPPKPPKTSKTKTEKKKP